VTKRAVIEKGHCATESNARTFISSASDTSAMMNLLRSLVVLALFVSLSCVSADDAAAEIDCAKDCADFVATVVKNEKATLATLESELSKCHKSNDELKKEHDDTVTALKAELAELQTHTEKGAALEKELRAINKELEQKFTGQVDEQKKLLDKAHELAKQSQQEVIEAKMEIANLLDSMKSTRINFKLIGEDIAGLWKKIMDKFKKDVDQKSDL
jgi:Skp family chaperone for outer membrane proteins